MSPQGGVGRLPVNATEILAEAARLAAAPVGRPSEPEPCLPRCSARTPLLRVTALVAAPDALFFASAIVLLSEAGNPHGLTRREALGLPPSLLTGGRGTAHG